MTNQERARMIWTTRDVVVLFNLILIALSILNQEKFYECQNDDIVFFMFVELFCSINYFMVIRHRPREELGGFAYFLGCCFSLYFYRCYSTATESMKKECGVYKYIASTIPFVNIISSMISGLHIIIKT